MFEYVESVTMEGHLEKQAKFLSWTWTKYWFVLDEDQLCYYRDSQRNSAQGLIDLGQAESVRVVRNVNHGFPLEIRMKLDRVHVLSAASEDDQQKWVKRIKHAMMLSWRRSNSMQRPNCDSWSEDEDLIRSLDKMLSDPKRSEDVFNNNAVTNSVSGDSMQRVSRFPKRRTRVTSSEDELEAPVKEKPKVAAKPPKLPSAAVLEAQKLIQSRNSSEAQSPVSPRPSVQNGAPSSPTLHSSALRSPSSKSPGSPSAESSGPMDVEKTVKVKPSVAKKPPPVSPRPSTDSRNSNDSRTIHIANMASVVTIETNKPSVAPKPSKPTYTRKSAPLTDSKKLGLAEKQDEKKRSSSLSAMQEATMAHRDEISKTNSVIVMSKESRDNNSNTVEGSKSPVSDEGSITYPMSILRRKPVRTEALKSCSDLMDNDKIDLESLSGESQTSEFRDSIFESPMLKKYKKSQHFLIEQDSLPDYARNSSRTESTGSEPGNLGYDPSILRKNRKASSTSSEDDVASPKGKFASKYSSTDSEGSGFAVQLTKKKVQPTRSNAFRLKPSSPTSKLAQHKSLNPEMFKRLDSRSPPVQLPVRHSDASGSYPSSMLLEDEEEYSDDENIYEQLWEAKSAPRDPQKLRTTVSVEDMVFDFPAVPALPHPRLEMRFDSPFDEIRRFLAYNRGPNEVFPVPRKSERGGNAVSRLQKVLARLQGV